MRAGRGCKSVEGRGGGGIFFRNVLVIFLQKIFISKIKKKGYFFEERFYLLNPKKTITYFWRKILSLESRGSASRVGRVSRKGKAATCRNFSSGKGRKETKRKIHSDKYSKLPVLQSAEGLKKKENTLRRIHEKYLYYMWKDSVQIAKPLTMARFFVDSTLRQR